MPGYEQPLARVLDRIQQIVSLDIQDLKDQGEWFLLVSDNYEDPNLFSILKQQWQSIVGPSGHCFALIHCRTGRDPGVWLHYLGTEQARRDYLCSCHQIATW